MYFTYYSTPFHLANFSRLQKYSAKRNFYIKCNLYVWQNLCKEIQNIIFHIKVFATRGFLKRIYKQNPFFYLQGRKLRQY